MAVQSKTGAAGWRVIVSVVGVLLVIFGLWYESSRRAIHATAKLTDRDKIVLADFANKTDDPVFSETLRRGLTVQLEQSPFLSLVSEEMFSRRVVGWSMNAAMTARRHRCPGDGDLAARQARRAHPSLRSRQPIYQRSSFQRLMTEHGVTCSMSRSGNVWDNAAMESFFSSLKTERIARKVYRTRDEARAHVFDYIERFYNTKRRHSTIGYLSPMEFEMKAGLA